MKLSWTLIALAGTANASRFFQTPLVKQDDFEVPGENTLSFCTDPKDHLLSIDFVDLSPNPPVPGQNLTITAGGKLSELVDKDSKVHISVKWNFVTLINKDYDLCDNANVIGKECPLEKGQLNILKEVAIPREVPPGKYAVTAEAVTKDEAEGGKKITCLKGDIQF